MNVAALQHRGVLGLDEGLALLHLDARKAFRKSGQEAGDGAWRDRLQTFRRRTMFVSDYGLKSTTQPFERGSILANAKDYFDAGNAANARHCTNGCE